MIYYIIILIMTMMGAVAALFLKKASSFKRVIKLFSDINFYIGGVLYFVSALLNIFVLRVLDYSIVLPMTSITYIWTMALSYFIFGEKITKKKIIGLSCVFTGVVLIAIGK